VLALSTQLIAEVLSVEAGSHYFPFHLYIPVEYMLLTAYYYALFKTVFVKWVLTLSNLLLIAFCFIHYYDAGNFWLPDFSDFALEAVMVTFLVIFFFISLFRKEEELLLFRYPDFWINTGNLFFYGGCLFLMGLNYSLQQENPKLAEKILGINHYLNLSLYLFYIIAFTCHRTETILQK
jgi:hypothetical protein